MTFYSPLRYPGGKRKLIKFLKEIIRENSLAGGVYVEPYAGGASLALSLLLEGYVSKIIINDLDRSIFALWHSILFRTEELCNLIERTPLTIKNWKKQKEIQENKNKCGLLELGFSTLFLNRTNKSGILCAGVIGGLKQKGKWKIDSRFNKGDIINRIRKISIHKDKIKIYNQDAIEFLKKVCKKLPKKALIYMDPPYYAKGKELYMNHYKYNDHKIVSINMNQISNKKWIITYDDVPQIRELYKKYKQIRYSLRYSAGNARRGKEIMIFSKNLVPVRKNSGQSFSLQSIYRPIS